MPPQKTAFPPLADADSRVLILGSMPGDRSLQMQQYYGHRGNGFWKLLFAVFAVPFSEDYEVRKDLLRRNHIALWDVLAACEREGSADANITNAVPNDFAGFYRSFPNIKAVCFAGKKAEAMYRRYVAHPAGIGQYTLPSPSGAYAALGFHDKLAAWRVIETLL